MSDKSNNLGKRKQDSFSVDAKAKKVKPAKFITEVKTVRPITSLYEDIINKCEQQNTFKKIAATIEAIVQKRKKMLLN